MFMFLSRTHTQVHYLHLIIPRVDPESDEYFDELFNIFLMREQPVRYVYAVVDRGLFEISVNTNYCENDKTSRRYY